MFTYKTKGTCSVSISFDVDEQNRLHSVKFTGGCKGNLQGISRLTEGMDIDKVHDLLKGTQCHGGTSCPDQLAAAIEQYKSEKNS